MTRTVRAGARSGGDRERPGAGGRRALRPRASERWSRARTSQSCTSPPSTARRPRIARRRPRRRRTDGWGVDRSPPHSTTPAARMRVRRLGWSTHRPRSRTTSSPAPGPVPRTPRSTRASGSRRSRRWLPDPGGRVPGTAHLPRSPHLPPARRRRRTRTDRAAPATPCSTTRTCRPARHARHRRAARRVGTGPPADRRALSFAGREVGCTPGRLLQQVPGGITRYVYGWSAPSRRGRRRSPVPDRPADRSRASSRGWWASVARTRVRFSCSTGCAGP